MSGLRIKKTNGNLVLHGSTKSYSLLTKKTFNTSNSVAQTTFTVSTKIPPLVFLRSVTKRVCFFMPQVKYLSPGSWEIFIDWHRIPLNEPLGSKFYARGGSTDPNYLVDTFYVYVFGDSPAAAGYGLLLSSDDNTFTITNRSLVIKDRGSLDLNSQEIDWNSSAPVPVGGSSFIATTPNPYPNDRCGKRLSIPSGISSPAICIGMVNSGRSINTFKDLWKNATDFYYYTATSSTSGYWQLGIPPCATAGPSYYATWQGSFPYCRQKKVVTEMMNFLTIDTALYD